MATEAALWKLMRSRGLPGHWTRVENRVEQGTPDVAFCFSGLSGWIELKVVDRWPSGRDVPVRVPHFTKQQRFWHRRHHQAGGASFVLLRVDASPRRYLLLPGAWAAEWLGKVEREMLEAGALAGWGPKWDRDALLSGLVESFPPR